MRGLDDDEDAWRRRSRLFSAARPRATRACWPLAIRGACAVNATFPTIRDVGF